VAADPAMPRMVFTFPTTHVSMSAEDALRADGLPIQMIPTPPGHGSVCGLSILIDAMFADRAQSVLRSHAIGWSEVFPHLPLRSVH
jgi:hypothetical protein